MAFKVLCIGDPHFKNDNVLETQLMISQLREMIIRDDYEFVVVLGDTFHTNEKLNLHIQKRVISFFKMLKDSSKELFILVGNHDRPNNNVFMTDDHPFTSLKEWGDKVHVIDETEIYERCGSKFVFVPYVPTGRFKEALDYVKLESPYKDVTTFFAHQEFKGCQMGAIKSEHGDEWPMSAPLCISGHIHDFEHLQPNMIYPGTPIQHTFTDRHNKTLSIFTFENNLMVNHKKHRLDIPRKLVLKLTPEELLDFVQPENSKVKIKVMGEISILRNLMNTDHVKNLLKSGVKIDECPTSDSKIMRSDIPKIKVKTSFQKRVLEAVNASPELKLTFEHIFPTMKT